jgi:hypothetical protein
VVQLLTAGGMLEDVLLQRISGSSELLAALGRSAGTLELLDVRDLEKVCKFARYQGYGTHNMADRLSHSPHQASHAMRCDKLVCWEAEKGGR